LSDADLVSLPYQRGDGTAAQAGFNHWPITNASRGQRLVHPSITRHPARPQPQGRAKDRQALAGCGRHSRRSKGPPGRSQSPRRSTAPEAVTRGQGRPASAFFQHRCGGRFDSGGGLHQQGKPTCPKAVGAAARHRGLLRGHGRWVMATEETSLGACTSLLLVTRFDSQSRRRSGKHANHGAPGPRVWVSSRVWGRVTADPGR
jgi:hypothetical protein